MALRAIDAVAVAGNSKIPGWRHKRVTEPNFYPPPERVGKVPRVAESRLSQ
jgi:hypothetical protein